MSSSRPRLRRVSLVCVRIRTSFPSIVRFSFSDELVRPDVVGIFSRQACLWGQHHVHAVGTQSRTHVQPGT